MIICQQIYKVYILTHFCLEYFYTFFKHASKNYITYVRLHLKLGSCLILKFKLLILVDYTQPATLS